MRVGRVSVRVVRMAEHLQAALVVQGLEPNSNLNCYLELEWNFVVSPHDLQRLLITSLSKLPSVA